MKENIGGILFVGAAIAFNFWFMGTPILFLNLGLVISLLAWMNFNRGYSRKLGWLFVIGVLLQILHFLEEYDSGFYKALPEIFGANAWTKDQFITFNIIWLLIFLSAAIGAFTHRKLSFLVLWFFLVIGCLGNGILHMGLSLLRQEYFPGTVTAFFLFIIGVFMIREISRSFQTPVRG